MSIAEKLVVGGLTFQPSFECPIFCFRPPEGRQTGEEQARRRPCKHVGGGDRRSVHVVIPVPRRVAFSAIEILKQQELSSEERDSNSQTLFGQVREKASVNPRCAVGKRAMGSHPLVPLSRRVAAFVQAAFCVICLPSGQLSTLAAGTSCWSSEPSGCSAERPTPVNAQIAPMDNRSGAPANGEAHTWLWPLDPPNNPGLTFDEHGKIIQTKKPGSDIFVSDRESKRNMLIAMVIGILAFVVTRFGFYLFHCRERVRIRRRQDCRAVGFSRSPPRKATPPTTADAMSYHADK